jgi:hypothetical protein
MADLNALIAQGAQFKAPPDPFEQYGRMQQLTQNQQTNQLNMMKMEDARRGFEEANQLRRLDPAAADYLAQVSRINPKLGFEYGKAQSDAETARLTQRKTQVEVAAAKKKLESQALRDISQNPSDAQIQAYKEDIVNSGLYSPQELQTLNTTVEGLMQLPYDQRKSVFASQGASPGELKPNLTTQNLGGTTQIAMSDPFSGVTTVAPGSSQRVTMTPGQAQANQIAEARLAQGERRLAGVESRAAAAGQEKPLTALQQQANKKDFANDSAKLKAAITTADELEKLTDELIGNPDKKIKPHPGLGGITGYAGVLPSLPSGNAAKAEQKLETFKGKIKALGRAIASQEGKLGNMAVQEWQMVSDAVQAIKPTAGNLDEQMRDVVRQARDLARNVQDKFDLTYEGYAPEPASGGATGEWGGKPSTGWGKAVAK